MQRSLALILLVVSFFWQALSVAGQLPLLAPSEEMEHAALHWQQASHHHHDDGTLMVDDSSASVLHVAADGLAGAPPAWAGDRFRFQAPGSAVPDAGDALSLPQPILDGLRRPPRLIT
jgi:hypothetical protein